MAYNRTGREATRVSTRPQLTHEMCRTLFGNIAVFAIFLCGFIMAYLAWATTVVGVDRDRNSRLHFRFVSISLIFIYFPALIAITNTLLFTLLDSGVHLDRKFPRVMYYPEISLLVCLITLYAGGVSLLIGLYFFFKAVDVTMIFVFIGLQLLLGLGIGPLPVSLVLLYSYMRPWSWYFSLGTDAELNGPTTY